MSSSARTQDCLVDITLVGPFEGTHGFSVWVQDCLRRPTGIKATFSRNGRIRAGMTCFTALPLVRGVWGLRWLLYILNLQSHLARDLNKPSHAFVVKYCKLVDTRPRSLESAHESSGWSYCRRRWLSYTWKTFVIRCLITGQLPAGYFLPSQIGHKSNRHKSRYLLLTSTKQHVKYKSWIAPCLRYRIL